MICKQQRPEKVRYEASLSERRSAACDPDNWLIAAQGEKGWEAALRRVEECQARLKQETHAIKQSAGGDAFVALVTCFERGRQHPSSNGALLRNAPGLRAGPGA